MAFTLRGTYEAHSDSATSLALNLASLTGGSGASVVNGDLVIAFPQHDVGGSVLSPLDPGASGWTALEELPDNASASVRAGAWYRIWTTGDTTVPAFQTAGLANNMIVRCAVFDLGGATLASVAHNSVGLNSAAATITATAHTFTGTAEIEVVAFFADDLVTVSTAPTGGASPSDLTALGTTSTAAMMQAVYYHLAPTAGSRAPGITFSGNTERIAIHLMVTMNSTSAALTGTAATSMTEQRVRDGGYTIILTLTGDTFVAAGATFDAQRQAIINGIDSGQAEAAGWDAVVKAGLAVSTVVRTSNTVVTVTLSAFASYQITATETITATIPAAALTGGVAIVAAPTFTVTRGAGDLVQPVGVTNASGIPATSSGSFTTDRAGLIRFVATVDGVTIGSPIVVTAR